MRDRERHSTDIAIAKMIAADGQPRARSADLPAGIPASSVVGPPGRIYLSEKAGMRAWSSQSYPQISRSRTTNRSSEA
jgi:hypothetical protein